MTRVRSAQIIFCIAALLFIAKPFVGFGMYGHLKSPVRTNIFVKIFSKRKIEDGRSSMNAIQKQLSHPATNLFLRFAFLLSILFPLAFKAIGEITLCFLHRLHLQLLPQPLILFTGQLLIWSYRSNRFLRSIMNSPDYTTPLHCFSI